VYRVRRHLLGDRVVGPLGVGALPGWLIAVLVVVGVWVVAIAGLVVAGKRSAARELATLLPNLVVLFRGLLRDPRVSRGSKALVWFAVVWVVSPIDLIPEFIPIAGPLDDAIVAALVLRHVLRRSGADVVAEHWHGDPATLSLIVGAGRGGT
jgi:uncharacterized membrane protein YkvA (DUF1232 family)